MKKVITTWAVPYEHNDLGAHLATYNTREHAREGVKRMRSQPAFKRVGIPRRIDMVF